MKRLHPPTARQLEILRILVEIAEETGQPPSARQLATALGVTHAGARKALASLEAHGWLADIPVQVSSGKWRLTDAGRRWLGHVPGLGSQKGISSSTE